MPTDPLGGNDNLARRNWTGSKRRFDHEFYLMVDCIHSLPAETSRHQPIPTFLTARTFPPDRFQPTRSAYLTLILDSVDAIAARFFNEGDLSI
jgi:hypothetical protein